jgi:hypothetical protein
MNSATNRVCSTNSPVSGDTSVVGMIPSRKSAVDSASPSAAVEAASALSGLIDSPPPGWRRLPTINPMTRANVDMTMK